MFIEWEAQIQYAIFNGIQPSHIDSHHHVHMLPELFDIYIELAKKYNLAIRLHTKRLDFQQIQDYKEKINANKIPHADVFTSLFYDENATLDFFRDLPETEKTYEVMCHPAFIDYDLMKSAYNIKRAIELDILKSKELKELLAQKNIKLISFREL